MLYIDERYRRIYRPKKLAANPIPPPGTPIGPQALPASYPLRVMRENEVDFEYFLRVLPRARIDSSSN